ncbi:MAG: DNA-3-methyladenine glycosylase [Bacteroidetes bacterium]|nr:DNA-3-methyladenine glycosylase [Bacteroidota bacterium]
MRLTSDFYLRKNVTTIARQLLGKVLFTKANGQITGGLIVETEAYSYKEKGCHAHNGMTKRNEVMFEPGGVAYVYLCYGVHEMFNVVTNGKGKADAILVRALEPVVGIDTMKDRMKTEAQRRITSGPGKLTKALGIDRSLNGKKLNGNEIWIEDQNYRIRSTNIVSAKRIGIDYAGEDALLPWRFFLKNNIWVSKL